MIITITILITSKLSFSQYIRCIFIQCCLDFSSTISMKDIYPHLNDWPEKYCANIFVTFNSTLF